MTRDANAGYTIARNTAIAANKRRRSTVGLVCGNRRVLEELPRHRTPSGHLLRRVRCVCSECGTVASIGLAVFKKGGCRACWHAKGARPAERPGDVEARKRQAMLTDMGLFTPWIWHCLRVRESAAAMATMGIRELVALGMDRDVARIIAKLDPAEAEARIREARADAFESLTSLLGEANGHDIAALTGVTAERVRQITEQGKARFEMIARSRGLELPAARDERTWPETYGEAA